MSFDYWWFSLRLTPELEEQVAPLYEAAARRAVLGREASDALREWQEHGECFDMTSREGVAMDELKRRGERYNRFIGAFNLPGFEELGEETAPLLSDDTCFRFIMLARCSAGAILWQSLGRERAERLPGTMGTLFCRAGEVARARQQAEFAMQGLDMPAAVARGMALAGHSNGEGDVGEVITHLLDGLRDAQDRGTGFMAVARPQI